MGEDTALEESPENSPAADNLFAGGLPLTEALEKLRLRLLDLTARNRLLNFKHTAAKSLQFVEGELPWAYQRLIDSNARITLLPVPEPKRADWVQRMGRPARPDVRDYARQQGISTSYELAGSQENRIAGLRALLYPDELERQCRKLSRAAKTAIEETGANMLFLLLGFLEFPEAPQATRTLLAPLVAIPIALERGDLDRATGTYRYTLAYTGEELTENLSLREKLKADFSLELPNFTEETSFESYHHGLERAIAGKPGFKLKRQASIALVSITKMLLVRDLDPKNWPRSGHRSALTDHEIVRMVFEGQQHEGDDSGEEYDVDRHELAELPLIFDADSSQHSALIDAVEGKNLVIEGPPGTGKSQTITNLVASSISAGKKVLFVAEKLAALQVVKARLTQAGLADFCLELHSNKTAKKDVLESIATRAGRRYSRPPQLDSMVEALKEKRRALTHYVELINMRSGNAQGMTIHQILWKAERYRQMTGDAWQKAQRIKVRRAEQLTRAEFESLYDELSRLVQQHDRIQTFSSRAPFWGFFPASLPPAAEVEIEQKLGEAIPFVETLKAHYIATASALNASELGLSKADAAALSHVLSDLSSHAKQGMADDLLHRLFEETDMSGNRSKQVLERLATQQAEALALRKQFDAYLLPVVAADQESRQQAEQVLSQLNKLGLADCSAEYIQNLGDSCRVLATEAKSALDEFEVLADAVGVKFDASDRCISQIAVPIEVAATCPLPHLARRTPQLAEEGSAAVIQEARQRFAAISKHEAELSQRLYLDTGIIEQEVQSAVLTLREGDEWWRIFQPRHRRAMSYHHRIAKTKKMSRAARRQELETLHAYLRENRLARNEPRYLRLLGPHWSEERTEFEPLHALSLWLARSNAKLLEAELDGGAFAPMTITAAEVVRLSNSRERLAQARAALDACGQLFAGPLQNAATVRKAFAASKSWRDRLSLLTTLGERLSQHALTLTKWASASQSAHQTTKAMCAKDEYRKLLEVVHEDVHAKELIGSRHRGLETDLTPILDAHEYGKAILASALPAKVQRALLSRSGNALRQQLLQSLADIHRAWAPVDAFFDFLTSRGEFDLEAWAGYPPSDPKFVDALRNRLEMARANIGGLLDWAHYIHASRFAAERGLKDFVVLLEQEQVPRGQVPPVFAYRFFGTIAEALFEQNEVLRRFSGLNHETIRQEFRKLDRDIIESRGKDVAAQASRQAKPPAGSTGARVADKSELALLQYLIPQTRPRMPIRQMMKAAGRAIQEYKPCFMMGPQAVAQYLEPGAVNFDIVVMDEASQLKPEEALGAIARGKQLIVVGDPKQLPPTVFFDKLGETQDEDSQTQAALLQESILDVCMGHFRPVRTLRWHYRSQHESLIAFSNSRFYRSKLIVFPSPYALGRQLGVKSRFIQGATYQDQMNLREAEVVVESVLVS